ncbi:unnamed protein product [Brachionus calyciflorus]|uniref:Reverse transcriptase Ty1/copia-type domain-containing protein n=1 Tax=Brachionus calyciflorus TaxID=104777 RepID=A0A814GH42_9BILA|nr:unnamed protein product [Brachionus calyciflorus]
MIGYGESEGVYWIYDKENQKAFRSRDIKFNENRILANKGQETNELILSRAISNTQIKDKSNEEDNDDKKEKSNGSGGEENEDFESKDDKEEKDNFESKEDKEAKNERDKSENNSNLLTVPRRSNRASRPPERYRPDDYSYQVSFFLEYLNLFESDKNNEEPTTFDEAINFPMKKNWNEAIKSEINSLEENDVWSFAKLPDGMKTIKTKWLFKIKRNAKNEPVRYKARLVAKGYDQEMGIDYQETFAPVVKLQSLRLLIAIAVQEGLKMHHVDISTAFLYGDIDEEIYIDPPEGFTGNLKSNQVLKLNRALYGLKQAPRCWNKKLVNFLKLLKFKQLNTDNCVFYSPSLFLAIYVDDIVIMGAFEKINFFKSLISDKFKTKDLGELSYILGLEINYLREDCFIINQQQYIDKIIKRFGQNDCKQTDIPIHPNHKLTSELSNENDQLRKLIDAKTYRQAIGSLIYLMISTRPDISYSVSVLSRYMQMPRELHWRYLKRLLRYVKTTKHYNLVYQRDNTKEIEFIGYSDADYAGNIEDRKSTSGYVFKYKNCPVSWNCSKQKVVSLSSTESEYIALTLAVKEGLWLNQLLNELNLSTGKVKIFCDNKSTICLTKNPEFHSRSKHIDIRYHFVREKINERLLDIEYLPTEDMVADILTKGLSKVKHYRALDLLNLRN